MAGGLIRGLKDLECFDVVLLVAKRKVTQGLMTRQRRGEAHTARNVRNWLKGFVVVCEDNMHASCSSMPLPSSLWNGICFFTSFSIVSA